MAEPRIRTTRHRTTVPADPDQVYALLADAGQWPQVFTPTVHAEVTEVPDGDQQLIHLWALANGEVRDWTSRRTLDPAARRITFRQVVSSPPVASMGGEWQVDAAPDGGSEVTLLHDWTTVDDDEAAADWIGQAVERNSTAELEALSRAVTPGPDGEPLRFAFADSVDAEGPAEAVYEFLARAELWPERLPHVSRLDLTEQGDVQRMEMVTRAPDGSEHTTVSLRVLRPEQHTLVYKQTVLPAALASHTGRWTVEPHGAGVRITSWHGVTLDVDGVARLLGPDTDLAAARARIRHNLGANSTTTMRHAKEFAEQIAQQITQQAAEQQEAAWTR
ncbi:aromatase/cyclase [Kitasatospora griseola]|uniref:aromatase/cyclase n=1 Tax=Kitasatospora griseola TaxID=2064 RepID=UPI00166FB989|nr:aromatase/cyclase [Kitasatospora griseola]GGQ54794.1 actinorhodin polyketide synthase bifunctional cyclase/dehydratase [Kitasatospora griseola]